MVGAVLAGGFAALLVQGGPQKWTMHSYATEMCESVIEPTVKQRSDLVGSSDFERMIVEGNIANADDAQEAIELTSLDLDLYGQIVEGLAAFNDDHIVEGNDGAGLQEELRVYIDDARGDLEDARLALDNVEGSVKDSVLVDFEEVFTQIQAPDIYRDERDPGYDLATELTDVNEECSWFDTATLLAECETERSSLVTAWNAASTSNKVGPGTDTYRDYLADDAKYFNPPTDEGATRSSVTVMTTSSVDCRPISGEELQDK